MKHVLMICLLFSLLGCSGGQIDEFVIIDVYKDAASFRYAAGVSEWVTVVKQIKTGRIYKMWDKRGFVGDHITACDKPISDNWICPTC